MAVPKRRGSCHMEVSAIAPARPIRATFLNIGAVKNNQPAKAAPDHSIPNRYRAIDVFLQATARRRVSIPQRRPIDNRNRAAITPARPSGPTLHVADCALNDGQTAKPLSS